jgi:DNA modification methylase
VPLGTLWDDIKLVQSHDQESISYPTRKPLKLLEQILEISSKPNDIVLDEFCGCGTTLVAAQNLERQWIGMDISPTLAALWRNVSAIFANYPKMKNCGA